jgi:hypothetical protein
MAFTCEHCRKAQPQRTKPIRVVIERKNVDHPIPGKAGITAPQIVREINVCETCAPTFRAISELD